MSSKSKSEGNTEIQATAIQAETGDVSVGNPSRDEEIRRRAYEIYLERGEQPAANWTIGSKRNANSTEGCCRTLSAGQRRLIWTYDHC
jgi:hypothetical protein